MASTVLRVSDVAGVGATLCAALEAHSEWTSTAVSLLDVAAGRGRLLHAAGVPLRAASVPMVVRRAVAADAPDVVHLHWARFAPLMPRSARPLLVHAHGSDVRLRLGGRRGGFVRRALERADAVVASTPDLLHDLPAGACYLPSPIDVDFFSPTNEAHGDPVRQTVLLFARLSPVKGGDLLVAFAEALRRAMPDVAITAFSSGSFDDHARRVGIRLLPSTDRVGVRSALRDADVVIGQQKLGVLGLSELEAMACERPVIAALKPEFRSTELPVIPAGPIDQMVLACVDLLSDAHSRASLGRAGRRFVTEQHAPRVIAERLVNLYEDIC